MIRSFSGGLLDGLLRRRSTGATEEAAVEIKDQDPREITSNGSQAEEERQPSREREDEQKVNRDAFPDVPLEVSRSPRNPVGGVGFHHLVHFSGVLVRCCYCLRQPRVNCLGAWP